MQVEKDIQAALDMINKKQVDKKQYRKVKLFTDYSLKHFKKYNLENKDVLIKCRSYDQIADLLSYGANVTCYSSNRFDEYFLKLFIQALNLDYKTNMSFFISNYSEKNIPFDKNIYENLKTFLDEKTIYFFDEIYKKYKVSIFNCGLIEKTKYSYTELCMCIRYLIKSRYILASNNKDKLSFDILTDTESLEYYKNRLFSLIVLSYNLDNIKEDKLQNFYHRINKFLDLSYENGKVQGFVSKNEEILIENTKRIQTRSINDLYSQKNECKQDYAYVYSK